MTVYTVVVCEQFLREGTRPGPKENYEPGCGSQCRPNLDGRWECPRHGDQITVRTIKVAPVE